MFSGAKNLISIFMCGDVMTGRGIDCILPHPGNPVLYEPYMKSAEGYVELAEEANGPVDRPVNFSYIWGDAIDELEKMSPDLRIINLETSITKSEDYWPDKAIHYRMNPENIPCLSAAKIDVCALSNNHILDWGYSGLAETLATLDRVNIKTAGAGQNLERAETPATIELGSKGRVIVFSFGTPTSGIPAIWGASLAIPGVNFLKDLSDRTVGQIAKQIQEIKRKKDIVIASIHWGGNWGYEIPRLYIAFAHQLIDRAGVDIIHGHSSHHVKAIEIYKNKPIIYGCGDFLTDYEGITGYEDFRDDLGLMYFVTMEPLSGKLIDFQMTPTQIRRFRVNRASSADALWLRDTLNREGMRFGTRVELNRDDRLTLSSRK